MGHATSRAPAWRFESGVTSGREDATTVGHSTARASTKSGANHAVPLLPGRLRYLGLRESSRGTIDVALGLH